MTNYDIWHSFHILLVRLLFPARRNYCVTKRRSRLDSFGIDNPILVSFYTMYHESVY